MKIKDLSLDSGVPAKTIRYYEEIGVLPPAKRLPNGYRTYSESDLDRLRLVSGARQVGLSLKEIREIIEMRDRGEAPCTVLLGLLEKKADEIEMRIRALQQLEGELRQLHMLGLTFPTDDVEGKECVCHLVSETNMGENP